VNNNKILRLLVRNALLLVSVILFLLSFWFYLDVELRRSESGSKKERNVSTGVEDID
jgi:hypothetical protein